MGKTQAPSEVLMNIVFLIATYNHGRLLPTLFSYLYKLMPRPTEVIFAENNSTDRTIEHIQHFRLPHELIRVWFRRDAAMKGINRYEPIAHIRQLLLTRARQLDPDFAIFFDDDILPLDPFMIDKLTSHGLDIVGGPYVRLFPDGPWLATKWRSENSGMLRYYRIPPEELSEVEMTSAGCLCLSRRIIQDRQVNFWPLFNAESSEDFGYCLQAKKHGYTVWLDGTVVLQHYVPRAIPLKAWSRGTDGVYAPFQYAS
jgi:GT2 family glycosyltransferase